MRHRSLFAVVVAALLVAAAVGLIAPRGFGGTAAAAAVRAPAAPAATAGCGKAPALASGTHTIQSSGQTRSACPSLTRASPAPVWLWASDSRLASLALGPGCFSTSWRSSGRVRSRCRCRAGVSYG